MQPRPLYILASILALSACAPAKDLSPKEISLSVEANPSEPLSPAGVDKMASLLKLYAPNAGMDKREIHLFFGRFQPEMQPLVDAVLPTDEARYSPSALIDKLALAFPPLAWAKIGAIGTPADLHATLAILYPNAPADALEEISLRLTADLSHRGLIKAGLIMAALEKNADADLLRAKIRAHFATSTEGWENAYAAAMLLKPLRADARFPKARALHQNLFERFPRQKLVDAKDVEAFDWWLEVNLAEKSQLQDLLPRFSKAMAKMKDTRPADSTDDRIFDWQIAGLTDALLVRCELDPGEPYSKADIQVALFRVKTMAGTKEDQVCPAAKNAFNANVLSRGVWYLKAWPKS